jgi:RNA polymerase sigma factor for flagellar operon FliA
MKHDHASFAASYGAPSRAIVADRVRRFMPLVNRTAWHVHGMGRDGLEIEDLIQCGLVALTECAQKHDAPTEDGFAAYAKIRVRGAMLDAVRRSLNDTRLARKQRAAHERAVTALRGELRREPTPAEIARALGVSDAELRAIEASAVTLTPIAEEYDESSTAFAAVEPDPFERLSERENRDRLLAAMHDLPERLMLVLQLFYVEELNLTEIADVLEVSVPRVHQLRAKALKDLRRSMDS